MWELDYKESWAPKNWCFWIVVLEKTLESPLDCKEIQPVHPKGDQSWVFIGRTDAKAETPVLWPPDVKGWLIGKDPDAGKDWGQEEKGMTEDEMVGWHHRLNGPGFGWTLGVGEGQGGLACCGSWGRKESDTTERLNWTGLWPMGLQDHSFLCSFCFHDAALFSMKLFLLPRALPLILSHYPGLSLTPSPKAPLHSAPFYQFSFHCYMKWLCLFTFSCLLFVSFLELELHKDKNLICFLH